MSAGEGGCRPLVICYGNRLRSDDGVAWHVADRLAGDTRLGGVEVLCRHQLTPELADDVSRAARVVLVDAATGGPPGTIGCTVVLPSSSGASPGGGVSHRLTPEALADLTLAIYGRVPPFQAVTVAAASLGVGEHLSAPVAAAVGPAADAVARLVGHDGR